MLPDLRRSILIALGLTGVAGCGASGPRDAGDAAEPGRGRSGTVAGTICGLEIPGSARVLACRPIQVELEEDAIRKQAGEICASSLDCASDTCVMPPSGESATCAANACPACAPGEVCAPFYARRMDPDAILVNPMQAPPRDATPSYGCFPPMATSKVTMGHDGPCHVGPSTSCQVEQGDWVCMTTGSTWDHRHTCGRALFVHDTPTRASAGAASDWSRPECARDARGDVAGWSARIREIAFEEHASVAAFARTVAQLLALGAPHALVAATVAAMTDEVEHARLAFALANAGGDTIGPGPFVEALAPLAPVAQGLREAMIEDVVRGGCVGETMAVLEAHAWRERASGAARAFLDRVVADETRHAALAFETVAWLVASAPSCEREAHRRAVFAAIDVSAVPEDVRDAVRSIAARAISTRANDA